MTKFILIALPFFLLHLYSSNCELKEVEYIKAIRSLYSKGIFDNQGRSLYLTFDKSLMEANKMQLNQITLNDRKVKILKNSSKAPWLIFLEVVRSSESSDRQILKFRAGEGGGLYSGDIIFECVNGQMIYIDTFFVSSID